jgi:hypothetical protein
MGIYAYLHEYAGIDRGWAKRWVTLRLPIPRVIRPRAGAAVWTGCRDGFIGWVSERSRKSRLTRMG